MSNQLVNVAGTNMPVVEYRNKRVITFAMIDDVHQRPAGTANRNFNKNRKHFIKDEEFFLINQSSNEIRSLLDLIGFSELPPRGLFLFTQMGYLILVKSFTDDLAWQVQRQLVQGYFAGTEDKDLVDRMDKLESIVNSLPHSQPTPPSAFENEYHVLTEFVANKGKVHTRTLCNVLELDHPSQDDYQKIRTIMLTLDWHKSCVTIKGKRLKGYIRFKD
jgi:hypothetical protein